MGIISALFRFKAFLRTRRIASENEISSVARYLKLSVRGAHNRIHVADSNLCDGLLRSRIRIFGCGNEIVFSEGLKLQGTLTIAIAGDNNRIFIGRNVTVVDRLHIEMLKGCRDGRVVIGEGTSFWKCNIKNYDDGSSVEIGKDCMFSYDTAVVNTDEHLILKDGLVCNQAGQLVIGNHCWVGFAACVLKSSTIPDGSIIGRSAVVSGKFQDPKSVIVGNPGRVVKIGLDWSRDAVNSMAGV